MATSNDAPSTSAGPFCWYFSPGRKFMRITHCRSVQLAALALGLTMTMASAAAQSTHVLVPAGKVQWGPGRALRYLLRQSGRRPAEAGTRSDKRFRSPYGNDLAVIVRQKFGVASVC